MEHCPHCGVSLQGAPIPEASRHWYGTATHFRREIGIYDMVRDRTVKFKCPDCHGEWPR